MNTKLEQKALQNFADKFNLKIKIYPFHEDKRKKTKFLLLKGDISISPVLNYENMNHFLLGINEACRQNISTYAPEMNIEKINIGDSIRFNTHSRSDEIKKQGQVLFDEGLGKVVIINGTKYELRKILNIEKAILNLIN